MEYESQIVKEVVEEMVQGAIVKEDGGLCVAMYDSNHQHVFSIQRATDEETKQLAVDLQEWLKGGMEKVLERVKGLANAAGGG